MSTRKPVYNSYTDHNTLFANDKQPKSKLPQYQNNKNSLVTPTLGLLVQTLGLLVQINMIDDTTVSVIVRPSTVLRPSQVEYKIVHKLLSVILFFVF